MDFDDEDDYEDELDAFLEDTPGILIPCESIKALQQLIYLLYDYEILDGEVSFLLKNVPENILEILDDEEYFDKVEVCGILMEKGQAKDLEVKLEELL